VKRINIDILVDGSVEIFGDSSRFRQWVGRTRIDIIDDYEIIVTDCRTLTDTAQYNIGWHDGYRANHNDAAVAAAYLEIDKRMVASLKPKDSIGE